MESSLPWRLLLGKGAHGFFLLFQFRCDLIGMTTQKALMSLLENLQTSSMVPFVEICAIPQVQIVFILVLLHARIVYIWIRHNFYKFPIQNKIDFNSCLINFPTKSVPVDQGYKNLYISTLSTAMLILEFQKEDEFHRVPEENKSRHCTAATVTVKCVEDWERRWRNFVQVKGGWTASDDTSLFVWKGFTVYCQITDLMS